MQTTIEAHCDTILDCFSRLGDVDDVRIDKADYGVLLSFVFATATWADTALVSCHVTSKTVGMFEIQLDKEVCWCPKMGAILNEINNVVSPFTKVCIRDRQVVLTDAGVHTLEQRNEVFQFVVAVLNEIDECMGDIARIYRVNESDGNRLRYWFKRVKDRIITPKEKE